jgi:chemotaxis protein CheD
MKERVGIAEFRVAAAPLLLKAYGLGSCVAISLYDPERAIGGLAHSLLPQRRSVEPVIGLAKYVEVAIQLMVGELEEMGASRQRLVAKIVGGANMFAAEDQSLMGSIGIRNAQAARKTLAAIGIQLVAEDVGGNRGRTVEFDLATGELLVYCARGKEERSL